MAKHGKLQTTIEYVAARSILATLGKFPFSVAMSLGRAIGRLAYVVAGDLRRTGRRNLLLAFPEKSAAERDQLLRGCFSSLGRELALFSKFSTSSRKSLLDHIEPRGVEHLESTGSIGEGRILFTAHLGAWELTSFSLSLLGQPLSFLVRRLDNPKVEQLVDRIRIRFGNQTLDKSAAARSMVKILRSGGTLGLLLDLNTLDEEAIFVNFFGVPAATTFMIAKLALRTGAPIVPIFAPWDDEIKKFIVTIESPLTPEATGDEAEDVRRLTEKLSLIIENAIRRNPDQWLWVHKRWKTRPPGEPAIYN
jgi:Kdo2-lipid IVA lauroyltransferase/acyltransferase